MSQTEGSCLYSNCSDYLSGAGGQLFTSTLSFLFTAQCLLTENWPRDQSNNPTDLSFDYIVVGAGSAGCVVASRLSEDKCRRVLLVEAGDDPPLESLIPATAFDMLSSSSDWQYSSENDSVACQGVKNGRCTMPRGKTLGGSSSVNGMVYIRGNRKNYDDWAAAGNVGWDYDSVLKYFKKSENLSRTYPEFTEEYHSDSGPLEVSHFDSNNPLQDYINSAYEELGYDLVDDVNGATQYGVVDLQVTSKYGIRSSTAKAFLVPARDRENLVVFKKSLVTKIIFNEKEATGVVIRLSNGVEVIANANKEVIVCAGVVNTAQLLMLSGIGPGEHLEQLGITVLADLSVGQNLHDHIFIPIVMRTSIGAPYLPPSEIAYESAQYIALQEGFFGQTGHSHSPFITQCLFTDFNNPFLNTSVPNIQIYHIDFGVNSTGLRAYCNIGANYNTEICDSFDQINSKYQTTFFLTEILDAKSRGNISLASIDPTVYPKIHTNYLDKEEDVEALLEGINIVEKLTLTSAFREIEAEIQRIDIKACNPYEFLSKAYWVCIIHQMASTGYHPMGTCKMGPDTDPGAVVDPNLLVYGFKRLRVVDGSVIPSTVSGNINAPIIMIAEKASDLIKEAHANEECV